MPSTEAENDCRPLRSIDRDAVSKEDKQYNALWDIAFRGAHFRLTNSNLGSQAGEIHPAAHNSAIIFTTGKPKVKWKNYNSNQCYYINKPFFKEKKSTRHQDCVQVPIFNKGRFIYSTIRMHVFLLFSIFYSLENVSYHLNSSFWFTPK